MRVLQLIAEVMTRVPEKAALGSRWKASVQLKVAQHLHTVAVAARIDPQGRRREQYWCDGVRVEKAFLLRLTCSETECPHAVQVRLQWLQYRGARRGRRDRCNEPGGPVWPPAAPRQQASALQPVQPLQHDQPLAVCGHQVVARPARFSCFTPCPNLAHPPLQIDKSGFDLFEDGLCLGGGVVDGQGPRRPRLPTLQAVEAFVFARYLEARAAMPPGVGGAGLAPGEERGAN